ncbi:MAG: hypothetical protein ABSD13_06270 [Candidatus Korobacteraceae bacterium]|jgi:hypothetical protein
MMVRRAFILSCVGLLMVLLASCGQTYKLMSISVTPGALGATGSSAIDLDGIGSFQQLTVTALFSNSKTEDVTVNSTYQLGSSTDTLAPLSAVTVNTSGIVKAVGAACTWTATEASGTTIWQYQTQPYPVDITYTENGVTATTTAYVSVNSTGGSCYDPSNPHP